MRVLIISVNQNRQPFCVIPLGACIVADAACQEGHDVRMLDMMFEDNPVKALESALAEWTPDVVGISIRNIDNNDIRHPTVYFQDLPGLMATIRSRMQAIVVLGGAAVSLMPEEFLRYTGADWAVLGNGETVFPRMLRYFRRNQSPGGLPGVAWIANGKFNRVSPDMSDVSTRCIIPNFGRWIDMAAYMANLSTVPVQTKRGCPYDCVYGTYSVGEGRDYHLCDPDSVAEGIADLAAAGFRDIEFVDNVFNSPYDHAMTICEKLADLSPRARLQTLELNPSHVDDALLSAMEAAGFVGIGMTVESVSDTVLRGLKKGFSVCDVRRAAQSVRRNDLPCVWIFLLGGPGETADTVNETLDFARCAIRPKDVAFFGAGIRIYPGTELERIAREQGLLTVPPSEMLDPVFYLSPQLDEEWLARTVQDAVASHLNFLDSESLALPIVPMVHRIGHRLGVRHPIWRHTRLIRRTLRMFGMKV